MNKFKFLQDSLYNILAMAIPIAILQFLSLPFIGIQLGDEEYGRIVTIISLYTLLSFPFGNVLNNIRLLYNEEYKRERTSGDFNFLLSTSLFISTLMMIVGIVYYVENFSLLHLISILLISGLNLVREYLIVSFRLDLDFKAILYNNYFLGIGYIYGTFLFYLTGKWQFIFLLGYSISLLYIVRKSDLILEPLVITKLYKKTTYKSVILLFSSLLKDILNYADKLLIFPLLGPAAVSIYYTSTLIGKIMSMIITPINGVILSYIAKYESFSTRRFLSILLVTGIVGVVGYIFSILISPFVLHLLYPSWATESLYYIFITTATAIVGLMGSVVHPFVLKFMHIHWQLVINGSNVVVYVISSILLFQQYGLMGFCIGILISNVYQLILLVGIFVFKNKKK
ncbi:lipopolysaccharide biosynthesis protein [Ureibacillus acetophenoni]|uniref:O-antigen/teichoic acid export membrane protein n=1 Tax=Ureibacillus acetophenoni TaxID=614649 RepID=A0A285U9A5_9BACL|nr:hypothetical protein [Ureibacillus acetophenoni]SOC38399.1 hypothetical protein SAMN05877842_104121 [Ureibacillus acetophenoni]